MSANERQVGGSHYKQDGKGEEHWDRVYRLKLDYFQGQITKYVERHKLKGGKNDLEKAKHFIEKYIEVYYQEEKSAVTVMPCDKFLASVSLELPIFVQPDIGDEHGAETVPASLDAADWPGFELGEPDTFKISAGSPLFHFPTEISKFNMMYGLPQPAFPQLYSDHPDPAKSTQPAVRLKMFKKIMLEEVDEVDEIISGLAVGEDPLETMTKLADWLGDIQVYAASEMLRWGIPLTPVLADIMNAQWSKLGADGIPIVKDGKVQKGPNYVAPEPAIRKTLIKAGMAAIATREIPEEDLKMQGLRTRMRLREEAGLRGKLDLHEDDEWQCEGFYGDRSQLYRHRGTRKLIRASSLAAAHDWFAAQPAR